MTLTSILYRTQKSLKISLYELFDSLYLPLDKKHILRTKNIRLIPNKNNRRGGKYSYAEWAHVIGIFQTLMFIHLEQNENNSILDIGCGTGLLGVAGEPFLGEKGRYVGIDVRKEDVNFCRNHFSSPQFSFIHLDASNPHYASKQIKQKPTWDINNDSFDLVTALSVWTHFDEEDACFYFKEVERVLKPGGKAIITFFLLDKIYKESLSRRSNQISRYHLTLKDKWIFSQPAYGSSAWFCPQWAIPPEKAIGVMMEGLTQLQSNSDLQLIHHYTGNWKEVPGLFFQDILVFQKA